MQRGTVAAALVAGALLWSGGLTVAQQTGSEAEAKAMFDRAVRALKANEAAALSAFNDKSNKEYHDRDIYVFCYNMSDGKFTAHPNPAIMNTDVRDLKFKDVDSAHSIPSRTQRRGVSVHSIICFQSPVRLNPFRSDHLKRA